jgi:hypothetical protein
MLEPSAQELFLPAQNNRHTTLSEYYAELRLVMGGQYGMNTRGKSTANANGVT